MRKRLRKPTREETAHHEAGHSVIKLMLGLHIERVTIVQRGQTYGMAVGPSPLHYNHMNRRELKRVVRDEIIGCYAGFEAERHYSPSAEAFYSQEDNDTAFELSRQYEVLPNGCDYVGSNMHRNYLESLRSIALRLVRRHWPIIESVATHLLAKGTLSEDEIRSLVKNRPSPSS